MEMMHLQVPLIALSPEQGRPGVEVEVAVRGRVVSLEGEWAVVEVRAVNEEPVRGEALTGEEAEEEEAAVRARAVAADEVSWPEPE